MLKDFKDFIMRGNIIDLAVGIVIGVAFGTIVKSLISDVVMPPIGLLLGGVDFVDLFVVLRDGEIGAPYLYLAAAKAAGAVTINYGVFINTVISFLVTAFAVFLIVRKINSLRREEAEAPADTMECQYCVSIIAITATRCPSCTSQLS